MFGFFKRKTEREKLNEKYKKLLAEAHKLSAFNRTASDQKQAEAQNVLEKLESL